jgi:arginase
MLCAAARRFTSTSATAACPRSVALIGAPLTLGQRHGGVSLGPAALRAAGLAAALRALGHAVTDEGDACGADAADAADAAAADADPAAAAAPAGLRHSARLSSASQRIAAAVQGALARGATAVTLGGDHSVGLGSIAGVLRARPDARVLWVDARACTPACGAALPPCPAPPHPFFQPHPAPLAPPTLCTRR